MRAVTPYEFFLVDFDQIVEEGRQQETINAANRGELEIASRMHKYFQESVLTAIATNDWVYKAAERFAIEYAIDCLDYLRLGGQEVFKTQQTLQQLNQRVVDYQRDPDGLYRVVE